jgi:hypothetical protein
MRASSANYYVETAMVRQAHPVPIQHFTKLKRFGWFHLALGLPKPDAEFKLLSSDQTRHAFGSIPSAFEAHAFSLTLASNTINITTHETNISDHCHIVPH